MAELRDRVEPRERARLGARLGHAVREQLHLQVVRVVVLDVGVGVRPQEAARRLGERGPLLGRRQQGLVAQAAHQRLALHRQLAAPVLHRGALDERDRSGERDGVLQPVAPGRPQLHAGAEWADAAEELACACADVRGVPGLDEPLDTPERLELAAAELPALGRRERHEGVCDREQPIAHGAHPCAQPAVVGQAQHIEIRARALGVRSAGRTDAVHVRPEPCGPGQAAHYVRGDPRRVERRAAEELEVVRCGEPHLHGPPQHA